MSGPRQPGGSPPTPARPLPPLDDPATAPHWSAAREGRLELPACTNCGFVSWPPTRLCPECHANEFRWRQMSGRASLWSWAVYSTALHPAFTAEVPYVVADVVLEEGPRLTTNVVGVAPGELAVGMPLTAVFEFVAADVALVRFTPTAG